MQGELVELAVPVELAVQEVLEELEGPVVQEDFLSILLVISSSML